MSSTPTQKQVGQTSVQLPQTEAAIRDLVPAGVLEVREDVLLQAFGVERPPHARARVLDQRGRRALIGRIRVAVRDLRHHLGAALAADPNEEPVLAVEQLGEREVVAALRRRAGAHRVAEAEPAGLGAVDDDDERALTASRVVAVDVAPAGEHSILDPDRREVAAADSEECERLLRRRLLLDLRDLAVLPSAPEPDTRRKQELLPRVRADREAEARLVVPSLHAVVAGIVDLRPACGELVGGAQLVVENRPVAQLRSDDLIAARPKRLDEPV